jgi:hypothetical protein
MTRAVAQTPSDLVLSSTTESQEAIEHAVSEDWKEPFIPKAEQEAEEKARIEAAKATLEEAETDEEKAERVAAEAEAQHADETPDERAQRIADEAEPVKGNWSKRVNKLTARNARIAEELRVERESRERLEARLSALERGESPTVRSDEPPALVSDMPGKPKRIDFKDEETYVSALIKYERSNEDYKEQVQEQREHATKIFAEHAARVDEAQDRYDDWENVAKSALNMILPPAVDFAIREMSNSADVLYFIAKHPEAYEKMSTLSPSQQVIEAGRISDRLAAGKPAIVNGNNGGNGKPRKSRSAPPEPIVPGGRRPTSQGKKLEDMDMDEYYRTRMAQRAQRRAH